MSEISKSPERHSFQKEGYIERCKKDGKVPNPDYVAMYDSWREQEEEQIVDPTWQKNNMEYDLRTFDLMLNKVRNSDTYAQNLYAAMCNRQFQKLDVMPVLKDERWSCSWRHAGGIIADMRMQGDYIDWYCSGIGNDDAGYGLDHRRANGYVPEGYVSDEIKEDLKQLGWIVLDEEDDNR